MKLLHYSFLAGNALSAIVFHHDMDLKQKMALYKPEWQSFKNLHSKFYTNDEEIKRFQIWLTNKNEIDQHNELFKEGKESFEMGINYLSDYTKEELDNLSGAVWDGNIETENVYDYEGVSIPTAKDWRDYGAVARVKNQGQCGSCWAFSASAALEGAWKLAGHSIPDLSEQDLVDCTKGGYYGNLGCGGGWMNTAFKYVRDVGGQDLEAYYRYEANDYRGCRHRKDGVGARVKTWTDIRSGDENALVEALARYGPIAFAMDVNHNSFYQYKGGIYYERACSSTRLSHAMTLVGYGVESGYKYWLIKNSWGTGWGENGYVKVIRGYNNHCGVATTASFPVVG